MCLGVADVTPLIDGVEQPQEGRRCKPFIYSGKALLSMTDFEKKVQYKIALLIPYLQAIHMPYFRVLSS